MPQPQMLYEQSLDCHQGAPIWNWGVKSAKVLVKFQICWTRSCMWVWKRGWPSRVYKWLSFLAASQKIKEEESPTVCIFDKVFASFWHLTCKNLHKMKLHVNRCARFRFRHVVWHVKEKTTRPLTFYILKWHVLLGVWHWDDVLTENIDVDWHSFPVLKTSRDNLDLKLNVKWNPSNIHTLVTRQR